MSDGFKLPDMRPFPNQLPPKNNFLPGDYEITEGRGPLGQVYDTANRVMTDPLGKAAISGFGSWMQQRENAKQNAAMMASQERQTAAQLQQRANEAQMQDAYQRAQAAQAANPLGREQMFAQRNALLGQALAGMRNFRSQPGDPRVVQAMGGFRGGFQLPEQGFSPEQLSLYAPNATLASLQANAGNIRNIDPNAQVMDWRSLFQNHEADQPYETQAQYQQSAQARQMAERAEQQRRLQAAIDNDIAMQKQQSGGGGFWSGLGKTILGAGASALTGGLLGGLFK